MADPVIGDAFGDILRQCWAAGGAPGVAVETIERDDGWVDTADPARYFGRTDDWPACEAALLHRARGRVLDVGCGAGRHLLALRERGLTALGVDPSPGAVAVCRERGLDAVPGDIDHLPAGPFDTFLLFGNNLGLLGSPSLAPGRLAALAAAAAPDARILASCLDPYHTGSEAHLAYHARNRGRGRPGGQLTLRVWHGTTATAWFDYWFVSLPELEDVLAGSPWRVDTVEREDDDAAYAVALAPR